MVVPDSRKTVVCVRVCAHLHVHTLHYYHIAIITSHNHKNVISYYYCIWQNCSRRSALYVPALAVHTPSRRAVKPCSIVRHFHWTSSASSCLSAASLMNPSGILETDL